VKNTEQLKLVFSNEGDKFIKKRRREQSEIKKRKKDKDDDA
jgi:hypothetical protein